MSRGPDDRELALTRETRALLALYAVEEQVERAFQELIRAQEQVVEQGEDPRRPRLTTLKASWQVSRGEAFWNRDTPEPVPVP